MVFVRIFADRSDCSTIDCRYDNGNSEYAATFTFVFSFYRATLCVSAVFAVARCLSFCPSVTFMDCIQMAEDIVTLLSQPGSPIILVL